MDKVAVLIPCYNEALTIEKVIRDFKIVLPEQSRIYVYDNNSSDGTAEIAEAAGAVVRHEYQQGKGNVMRRMFREIDAECYIIVDGDDTYPAESAPEMIDLVLNRQCDMVVGDRLSSTYFEENKRPFHNFGNVLVRKSINLLFRSSIKDIMTGYRAFSYQFVKTFPVPFFTAAEASEKGSGLGLPQAESTTTNNRRKIIDLYFIGLFSRTEFTALRGLLG